MEVDKEFPPTNRSNGKWTSSVKQKSDHPQNSVAPYPLEISVEYNNQIVDFI